MQVVKYFLMLLVSVMIMLPTGYANAIEKNSEAVFSIQVVQNQFNIDYSMIENAFIVNKEDGSYRGLEIHLNKSAAKNLARFTQKELGKTVNLVLKDKIISTSRLHSSLQNNFLLTDIKKEDAQKIIAHIKY